MSFPETPRVGTVALGPGISVMVGLTVHPIPVTATHPPAGGTVVAGATHKLNGTEFVVISKQTEPGKSNLAEVWVL